MRLKKIFVVLLLLLMVVGLAFWLRPAAPLPQGKLSAFSEGGKIGFKDETGKVILPPRFEEYRAQVELKFAPFNPAKGPPSDDDYMRSLEPFPDGLCLVRLLGKSGYIDTKGKLRIKAVYDNAQPFHGGQAMVSRFGIWSVIDRTGKTVRTTQYEDVSDAWSEGFTSFRKNGKYGFLNGDLKEISGLSFSEVSSFSNGLARVAVGEGAGKRWGFLGAEGKMVVECIYTDMRDFSEGLAAAATGARPKGSAANWGFLDAKGKFVVAPKYDQALDFSQGLAAVMVHSDSYGQGGDWGFIDKRGNVLIKPKFKRVSKFTDGVAAFTLNPDLTFRGALWGLVDQKGRVVVEPRFGAMPDLAFKNGRALVQLQGQYLWIDNRGNTVEAPP